MNRKTFLRVAVFAVAWSLTAPIPGLADDSAAAIAAGGLVPRNETRIVMAKEVLRIGLKKVVVDYDFRNDTNEDVTTEGAFPIPPYKNEAEEANPAGQSFKSFQLWVEGKPIQYVMEAKATIGDKDVSSILEADHIDIPSFGHYGKGKKGGAPDFERLPLFERQRLAKLGLCYNDSYLEFGIWTVHLQYHWTQNFPANSTVHIRHEYTPLGGFWPLSVLEIAARLDAAKVQRQGQLNNNIKYQLRNGPLNGFCVEPAFLWTILRDVLSANPMPHPDDLKETGDIEFEAEWVDFILTSANTWQRPIEDFTLIVERPKADSTGKTLISFCSPANGTIEKLDADHLQVHLTNFVPASELHIGFFEVPLAKPAQPAAKK